MNEDKYDSETQTDFEDQQEFEIKVDRYINNTILKIEDSLSSSEQDSKFKFYTLVEHLYTLCKSAGIITKETELKISENKEIDFKSPVEMFKAGHKKLNLIMTDLFASSKLETPIKI